MNMYQLFAEAQRGAAMNNFGAMYGLTPDQTRALVEAYLPAFSQGLGRKAHDPFDFAAFMRDNTTPAMQRFYNAMTPETVDPARQAGEQLMRQLFSPETPARMAEAASKMAGVPPTTAQDFMAPFAATLAGGMQQHMAQIPGLHEWIDAFNAQREAELASQTKARKIKELQREIKEQERLEREAKERAQAPMRSVEQMGDMMKAWTVAAMSANPFVAMLDHGQIPEPEEEPEPEAPEEEKHPMAAFFDLFDPGVPMKNALDVMKAMQIHEPPAEPAAADEGEDDDEDAPKA